MGKLYSNYDWVNLSSEQREALLADPQTRAAIIGWYGNGVPIVKGDYGRFCAMVDGVLRGESAEEAPPKRKRGRPRKNPIDPLAPPKRKRGRPRKDEKKWP
jgi:hypothetical protein